VRSGDGSSQGVVKSQVTVKTCRRRIAAPVVGAGRVGPLRVPSGRVRPLGHPPCRVRALGQFRARRVLALRGACATERDDACRCESRDVLRPSSRRPESCRGVGAGVCAESLPVRCGSREALRRPSPSASGSRRAPSGPRGTSARSGTSRATASCHRAGSCRTAARPSRRLRLAYVRRPPIHPPTDSARAMSQSFPYRARARRLSRPRTRRRRSARRPAWYPCTLGAPRTPAPGSRPSQPAVQLRRP
jgi:hypothetical protein